MVLKREKKEVKRVIESEFRERLRRGERKEVDRLYKVLYKEFEESIKEGGEKKDG